MQAVPDETADLRGRGDDGGVNKVVVERAGGIYHPPHLSKDQDILISAGDRIVVSTPGGGGYGDPLTRDPALVARDVRRGYYTTADAADRFAVIIDPNTLAVDEAATATARRRAD